MPPPPAWFDSSRHRGLDGMKKLDMKPLKILGTVLALSFVMGCTKPQNIHEAAGEGNVERVKSLLARDPQLVHARDNDDGTPLLWAAWKGRQKVAELLIESGANVNAKDKMDQTPLRLAAFWGHREVCEFLVGKGAESDIFIEALMGRTKEVGELLGKNPELVNAADHSGQPPLQLAAWNNKVATAKLLLEKGADVNRKDNNGNTSLHAAARKGNVQTAQVLMANKAQINSKNNQGLTPLARALKYEQRDMAKFLLKNGGTK